MKKLILGMAILSLMGCGSDSKNGSSAAAGGSLEELRAAPTGWKTACIQEQGGTSLNISHTFVNDTVVPTVTYYTDANCAVGDTALRYTESLVIRGTSATNSTATAFESSAVKLEQMPLSVARTNAYNSGFACGKTGWVQNQWKDVTATNCLLNTGTFFNIFKITGSTLLYGDQTAPNDGSTEAKRPAILDDRIFTKY